jgi:hypothetical protein
VHERPLGHCCRASLFEEFTLRPAAAAVAVVCVEVAGLVPAAVEFGVGEGVGAGGVGRGGVEGTEGKARAEGAAGGGGSAFLGTGWAGRHRSFFRPILSLSLPLSNMAATSGSDNRESTVGVTFLNESTSGRPIVTLSPSLPAASKVPSHLEKKLVRPLS